MPWFVAKVLELNSKVITLLELNGRIYNFRLNDFKKFRLSVDEGDFLVLNKLMPDSTDQETVTLTKAMHLTSFNDVEILKENFQSGNPDLVKEAKHRIPIGILVKINGKPSKRTNLNIDDQIYGKLTAFDKIALASMEPPKIRVEWDPIAVCSQLTNTDKNLSRIWMPPKAAHFPQQFAKMLSARLAERVAKQFYENLGRNVFDVSATQLDKNPGDWKRYDLLIDNTKPIDVKNARTPVSNKNYYVDYCVPRFKEDRNNKEVTIAGVFSPYLHFDQITGNAEIYEETNDFIFLGETTHSAIQRLEQEFSNEYIEIILMEMPSTYYSARTVLPPWIFDYPSDIYHEQEMARFKIQQMPLNVIPEKTSWLKEINPIPVLLVSGKELDPCWLPNNPNITFLEQLYKFQKTGRISLPDLYLSILTDCLKKIYKPTANYFHPRDYRKYLFSLNDGDSPLGIRDPLSIINTLISNLEILWNYRSYISWKEIDSFKIRGLGIVQARTHDMKLITLMAYCGGYIAEKGSCGNFPLIKGTHATCSVCHKLICDKCDFCSEKCQRYKANQSSNTTTINGEYGCSITNLVDNEIPF